ncbi:LOW QUALITY PROTEIN: hypothetical protein RJ639_015887 [Escallonia herrerae]|uniref:Acid phosphatase n=1 Tax=Escallonia herrerae TaxID=1293975 RepID=A0AA88VB71_9ASTE|nr:LOW QUALITY PROTEIN: hypothetical protein RJ639_015887 [Escallonia herrerae]
MNPTQYLVALLTLSLTTTSFSQSIIQLPTRHRHPLTGNRRIRADDSLYCTSWRFSVETNDAGAWSSIPARCQDYVKDYVSGDRYLSDSDVVAGDSLAFIRTVNVSTEGKDAWVFDIDETLLSNLPYYAKHGYGLLAELVNMLLMVQQLDLPLEKEYCCRLDFLPATARRHLVEAHKYSAVNQTNDNGVIPLTFGYKAHLQGIDVLDIEIFNSNTFNEWVDLAEAPALPASLRFYKELQELGVTIFLLTGRDEYQRNVTVKNLVYAGYSNWERLFLRGPSDERKLATVYKSEKRMQIEDEGYTIQGSSGDQWSDLQGFAVAKRSFKLPNPMYYIA